ncbi:MAG: PIG-L family deacetylase [Planctomycetales bacterium]|nr:PIG-L family deacetylase [Planctomycetales bacterium]
MHKSVLAIAAHPDDIEFVMSGTLLQLIAVGWQAHYFNIANGCCGSTKLARSEIAAVRLHEAQAAAALLPAAFYEPVCNDLEIFYTAELHAQVAAVVRRARPSIVLTHSLSDYMEDHQNTARLAVSAAFVRGMPNFATVPPVDTYDQHVAVYHAQPHGNCTPMGQAVIPDYFVETTDLLERKRGLLAEHRSQGTWLSDTQEMGSYLTTMQELGREVGQMSGKYTYAEGWRKHLHLGLATREFDPLADALQACIALSPTVH